MTKQLSPLNKHHHNEPDSKHAMTLRTNEQYHSYLEYLSIRTGLDMSQLIRLAIHLMPFHEEFQRVCDHYYNTNPRSSKDRFAFINMWNKETFGWKRV